MAQVAKGSFDVKLTPLSSEAAGMSRMSIEKRYRGPLEGTATGEMLSGGVPDNGSRAYVALESVTARLNGRDGSFLLAHRGTMAPSSQNPSVIVVPGSGTGELAGLSGEMTIDAKDGEHFYELTFEL